MIERIHTSPCLIEPITSRAILSPCEKYRYLLERIWNTELKIINFVMLNPSTATETAADPTATRCETRARRLGYGGFVITNLFAFRATDPKELRNPFINPIGKETNNIIRATAIRADMIILAWGDSLPPNLAHRAGTVFAIIACELIKINPEFADRIHHLGLNKSGNPKHPLYIPLDNAPTQIKSRDSFLRGLEPTERNAP